MFRLRFLLVLKVKTNLHIRHFDERNKTSKTNRVERKFEYKMAFLSNFDKIETPPFFASNEDFRSTVPYYVKNKVKL